MILTLLFGLVVSQSCSEGLGKMFEPEHISQLANVALNSGKGFNELGVGEGCESEPLNVYAVINILEKNSKA